jgi:hypothetical protein
MMKRIKLTTHETPEGGYSVTAVTDPAHLLEIYQSARFLDEIISRMAEKFVEENYERLTTGINFEQVESSVIELVKQKFADLLKLEPRKPEQIYFRRKASAVDPNLIDPEALRLLK